MTSSTRKLRIAKQGYDIETAEPRNMIFSDEYITPKVYLNERIHFTNQPTSPYYGNLIYLKRRHGLGYPPAFLTYLRGDDDRWTMMKRTYADYVTKDYIYVHGQSGETARYLVFHDPIIPGTLLGQDFERTEGGIYIAQQDKSLDNSKLHELAFNSDTDTLLQQPPPINIGFVGEGGGEGTYHTEEKIRHGLGYAPVFFPNVEINNSIFTLPYITFINGLYDEINVQVDEEYIYAYRHVEVPAWTPDAPDIALSFKTILCTMEL